MGICEKCGAEVADNAVFCKKCGVQVERKENEVNREKEVKTFNELSLEMRTIFDKVMVSYVSGMQSIEMEKRKIEESYKTEISKLKDLLDTREAELKITKDKLAISETEIISLKEKIIKLESNMISNVVDKVENEESRQFCPGCGELITEDMLFCGTCGIKLK